MEDQKLQRLYRYLLLVKQEIRNGLIDIRWYKLGRNANSAEQILRESESIMVFIRNLKKIYIFLVLCQNFMIQISTIDLFALQYFACCIYISLVMKQRSFPGSSTYLDISELLLKDLSPLIKPDVPHIEQYTINIQYAPLHTFLQTQDQQSESMTPLMTPFILDGIEVLDTPQHEDDLLLGIEYIDFGQFGFQAHHQQKSCHQKNKQRNKPFCDKQAGQYLIFDNELEMILADNEEDYDIFSEEYYSNFHQNSFESDFGSQQEIISPEDQQSQDNLFQDKNEEEKTESMNYENLPIQWLKANPKRKLIQNIQAIAVQYRNKEPEEVKSVLKKAIYPFIFEHQIYFLDQCFEQMKGNTSEMVEILIKGVSQNFKRNIRGLTFEKRRIKLFKYMEKKRRRIWKKKVNYDCRKKVADGRLRIKGKFVTYEQACKQAGEKDGINAEELKFILEKTKSQAISQV